MAKSDDYSEILEHIDDWRKAGKIASEALEWGKKLVKPGARAVDIADQIEAKIVELGAKPAFPVALSCDNIAAHYAPDPNDPLILDSQLVKLDLGAHINGAIGDVACTIDLSGKWTDLVKASRQALDSASKEMRPGMELSDIGKIIGDIIASAGFNPVRNLSGHGMSPFIVHDYPTVPNFDSGDSAVLEPGMIITSEPFATDGEGAVHETEECGIFGFEVRRPIRSPITRGILPDVEAFEGLPFTSRWLVKKHPVVKVNFALREMVQSGMLHPYPPLAEKKGRFVSQFERTFFVGKDKVEVLTPWSI